MALPEHLERLRQISIDTLGLSESTQAVLKWHGYISILDCITFFCEIGEQIYIDIRWPKHFMVLPAEVKPKLIAAGYWGLVLDAEVWQVIRQGYKRSSQRVVRWQGQDRDLTEMSLEELGLNEIPLEELGFNEEPAEVSQAFSTFEGCIDYFVYLLATQLEHWKYWERLGFNRERAHEGALVFRPLEVFLYGIVQPRLVELGFWTFVEELIDEASL